MKERIENKLKNGLNLKSLQVINNSHLHAGHAAIKGLPVNGETHFKVIIAFENDEKLSKIVIHRKINKILEEEFKNGLHALEIKVL